MRKDFMNNLWRWSCGLPERETEKMKLSELYRTEWSEKFENLMRNRLVLGAFRYGKLQDQSKPRYDRIGSIESRLKGYIKTGNTEFLVDIANMCMLEFVEGKHPNKHFKAIDDGEHTKIIKNT